MDREIGQLKAAKEMAISTENGVIKDAKVLEADTETNED